MPHRVRNDHSERVLTASEVSIVNWRKIRTLDYHLLSVESFEIVSNFRIHESVRKDIRINGYLLCICRNIKDTIFIRIDLNAVCIKIRYGHSYIRNSLESSLDINLCNTGCAGNIKYALISYITVWIGCRNDRQSVVDTIENRINITVSYQVISRSYIYSVTA